MIRKLLKLIFNFIFYTIKKIYSFFIYLLLTIFVITVFALSITKNNNDKINPYYSALLLENSIILNDTNSFNNEVVLFNDLYKALDKASIDDKISTLYINLDTFILTNSQIEELVPLFNKFKLGNKKIIAFSEGLDNQKYKLGIYADKILMPNSVNNSISINGYSINLPYFGNFFNKYGINFEIIHIGDYKNFGEQYKKSSMSEENRETITRINDKNFNDFIANIANNRKINEEKLNEKVKNGDYVFLNPKQARDLSLIDEVVDYNKYTNLTDKQQNGMISIQKYILLNKATNSNKLNNKNKIAIIYLDGEISKENLGIHFESFIRKLNEAKSKNGLKGIVLRINSPGGSALESKKIYEAISNLNIPVYTSIADVAASGGYYIASASDKIFANKSSLTGSIGVVYMFPKFEEALNKLNINQSTITNGKFTNLYSPSKNLNDEERNKIKSSLLSVYNEFKSDILIKRNKLDNESLEKIAGGRVFRADEALENGLIDGIANLYQTVDILQKDLNLNNNYNLIHIYTKPTYDEMIALLLKRSPLFNTISNVNKELNFFIKENNKVMYYEFLNEKDFF